MQKIRRLVIISARAVGPITNELLRFQTKPNYKRSTGEPQHGEASRKAPELTVFDNQVEASRVLQAGLNSMFRQDV